MADTLTRILISAVDQTQAGLNSVQKNLSGVQSMAASLGVTLSAVGMMTLVKQSIDAADSLSKLAQKTGTTVETLAGLKFAADQNGTSLEAVANAAKKLSTQLVDKPDLFAKMGITAKDSTGAMVQMADLFASMPDGVNKTALAVKLMGKSGEEMIPFLNQGSAALRGQIEQGKLFNPVTAEMAKQAELFNDQLDALKAQASGLGVTIANELLPNLVNTTTAMTAAAREGNVLWAVLRGIAGIGKIPFDLYTGSNGTVDVSSKKMIFDLKAQLGQLERDKQSGDSWLMRKIFGTPAEIDAKIAIIKNQLAAFEKFGAQLDKKPVVPEAKTGIAPSLETTLSEYDKLIAKLKGGLVDATAAAQAAQHGYNKEQEKALELFASPEWAKMSQKQRINAAGIMEATVAQGMQIEAQKRAAEIAKELVTATVSNQTALHGYNKEQAKALELFLSPAWASMSEAERAAAAAPLENATALGVQTDALEKAKKATEDAVKSNQDYMSGIGKVTEELITKAKAAEEENALIGMSAVQIAELTAKRYDEQIAILASRAATLEGIPGREAELFMIEKQIAALHRLKNAEVTRPSLQAQADVFKKFSEDINHSLTDALLRGFESGKGFGKNFVDTVKNMFNTMVLRPVISAILSPVSGALAAGMGAMGIAGGANASGLAGMTGGDSGGGLGGILQAGQSLWSAFSGGMASGIGSLAVSAGELFGSTAMVAFGNGIALARIGASGAASAAAIGGPTAMGASFAAAVPYVAVAAIALSVLPGLMDSIFGGGTSVTGSGVNVGVRGSKATGSQYTSYKEDGGWFSSDSNWTVTSAMQQQSVDAMNSMLGAVRKSVAGFSDAMASPAMLSRLDAFTASYSGAASGLDAWLKSTAAAMLDAALGIESFRRAGEETNALMQRLGQTVMTFQSLVQSVDNQIALMTGTTDQFTLDSRAATASVRNLSAALGKATDFTERVALEGQLVQAVNARYQLEIKWLTDLRVVLANVMQQASAARGQVGQSGTQIIGQAVLTAPQLREAISSSVAGLGLPSMDALTSASAVAAVAAAAEKAAAQFLNTAPALIPGVVAQINQRIFRAQSEPVAAPPGVLSSGMGYDELFVVTTNFSRAHQEALLSLLNQYGTLRSAATSAATATTSANTANTILFAAQKDYAAAMLQFAGNSALATQSLSALREETVRYYESQKQLAKLMNTSAAALGQTVSGLRMANLTPVNQFASLKLQFDTLSAGAAGMSGAELARRADQINSLAQPLMESARANFASGAGYQDALASVTGGLETLQSRLAESAPKDYQAESISLLSGIDAALGLVQNNLSAADSSIVNAINTSKTDTVDKLEAIRLLLGGERLPGHADGLGYVPYDDYQMRAHKGEAVIDAGTMAGMRRYGIPVSGSTGGGMSDAQFRELLKAITDQPGAAINLTVVTPDGKLLKEETLTDLKRRSKQGEVVIHAAGVAA